MTPWRAIALLFALAPLLAAAGLPASADEAERETICLKGTLTDEGVECPAFRSQDGTLYTLMGELGGLRPGDEACLCGVVAQMSFCMQGTPLSVSRAGPPDDCDSAQGAHADCAEQPLARSDAEP